MFGITAMLAGLIGVPLGSYLVQRLRPTYPKCDGLVCAWGLFISAPLVYAALVVAPYNGTWCFFLVFLAQISLNLCWSIVADILLVRGNISYFVCQNITLYEKCDLMEVVGIYANGSTIFLKFKFRQLFYSNCKFLYYL